jgi:hypothetical protein
MTDLRACLAAAREARIRDGWKADEIGQRCSSFFCSKDGVRLEVAIQKVNPSNPTVGHGSLRGERR